MFGRRNKPTQQPSHFRRFVHAKVSWNSIIERLASRPKGKNADFWRTIVNNSTKTALRETSFILAVDLCEQVLRGGSQNLSDMDEEAIVYECLLFSSCLLKFHVDDYFFFLEEEMEPPLMLDSFADDLDSVFETMSLIDWDTLDETAMERLPYYQECADTGIWRACLARSFGHVMTRMEAGEILTNVKIRGGDPVHPLFEADARSFIDNATDRLDEVGALLEKQVDDEVVVSMTFRD